MESDSRDRVIGSIGHVTLRIPGPGRPGEVLLSMRGGSESFIAYSEEEIPTGSQVLVLNSRPGRVVEVTPFPG